MQNAWVQQEWDDVCQRLMRCAEVHGSDACDQQAKKFKQHAAPTSYMEVLDRVRDAATLAISWDDPKFKSSNRSKQQSDSATQLKFDPEHGVVDAIDEAGAESFPASDPPAY